MQKSPYYWADIAQEHLRYMRSFSYDELNLWNITPAIPYRTKDTYGVRAYFPSCFADNVEEFNRAAEPRPFGEIGEGTRPRHRGDPLRQRFPPGRSRSPPRGRCLDASFSSPRMVSAGIDDPGPPCI